MKHTTIRFLSVLALSAALAGCGSEGETTESTGVDTSTGAGGGNGGGGGSPVRNPGRMQFNASSLTVAEGAGNATLTVTRTEGTDGAVSVTVTTSDGSAAQPADYTAVSSTVTFAAGDATAKTVNVPIVNDTAAETGETFTVTLSAPTGSAALGSTSQVLVTITDDDVAPPAAARAAISTAADALRFDWTAATGATSYRVMKDATGTGTFAQAGADLPASARSTDVAVSLLSENWSSSTYAIDACNASGCTRSNLMTIAGLSTQLITYLKASNSGEGDNFGTSVALSSDGNTLAVGSPAEDSAATGIGGNQQNDCNEAAPANCASNSGAAYVYTRSGDTWSPAAYVKASNPAADDLFGADVSLSADGNTLAVSATGKGSHAGAVYVFARTNGSWQEMAYLQASDASVSNQFGDSIALNAEGSLLAIGSPGRAAGAATSAGAVYVFTRSGANWTQSTPLTLTVPITNGYLGLDVSIAGTVSAPVVAAGAPREDIITGAPPSTIYWSGAAYVFALNGSTWTHTRIGNPTPDYYDSFGAQVSLSTDGTTLVISSPEDDLVPVDPAEPTVFGAGGVYVFGTTTGGATWTEQALLRSADPTSYSYFGRSLALSADGSTLVVGAPQDRGSGRGLEAVPDTSAQSTGAAHVFTRSGATWPAGRYVKSSNTENDQYFGGAVAVNGDGGTVAIGADGEHSNANDVNGDQFNDCGNASTNCAYESGAVYVY